MIGKSLGPYDILEPIGAGGMGEVYLALDTRLRRKVAIKVLPDDYAADPERLARFTLEARASAALNHVNIAAVYDVGEVDGTHFMVQEYLRGETLQHALVGGALPIKRVLRLGSEIAAAIAAAHEAGIVHRDLKPANVFVVKGDHAKVLDFGLAKVIANAGAGDDLGATATAFGTVAGVVMGSPGYMAPEQIRGAEIDQRTDVFAFGCVLYEMASGARAFGGETAVEVLNGILNSEPTALAEIDPMLPMDLVRIVGKCLAKDPARRYQNSNDLVVDLAVLADAVSSDSALSIGSFIVAEAKERPKVRTGRHPLWWPSVAGVLVLIATVVGYAGRDFLAPATVAPPAPLVRSGIIVPAELGVDWRGWSLPLAMSPDSTRVVFTAGTPTQLYVRELAAGEPRPIPGTENGSIPFFSPNGEWVGFFENSVRLKRIRLATGEVQVICECSNAAGSTPVWRADDVIVWPNTGRWGPLLAVPATGGTTTTIALPILEPGPDDGAPAGDADTSVFPTTIALLPDGETIIGFLIFTAERADQDTFIGVASNSGGGWRRLTPPGFINRDTTATGPLYYLPSGHLVYGTSEGVTAVPFDPVELKFLGSPTLIVPDVEQPLASGSQVIFAVSTSGSLVFTSPRPASAQSRVVSVDHEGAAEPLRATKGDYSMPRVSPGGTEVVYSSGAHVWLLDLERGTETRLSTEKGALPAHPIWTPSGTEVVMNQGFPAPIRLVWASADSTGATRTAPTERAQDNMLFPNDWGPNGELVVSRQIAGEYDIRLMQFDENGEPLPTVQLVVTSDQEGGAIFSSRPTATGLPTPRTSRASSKSMRDRTRGRVADGRSRPTVVLRPCGRPTAARSTTVTAPG